MLVNLHIAFGNIISLSASILIVSAHSLIAFWKAIRLSPRIFIASTLPSDTTCSLTVPGGDTPCVTAGDARRANPWRSDALTSDAGSVAQQPRFCTSELPLHAFSATPPASECLLSTSPTGSPSLWLGYHPRLRMVRLRRRHYSVWM